MHTRSSRTSHTTSATPSTVGMSVRPFPVQAMKKQGHLPHSDESSQEVQSQQNSLPSGRSLSDMNVFPRQNPSVEGATELPGPLRAKMERAFRTDLSQVRIHADDSSADSINALAATQGKDIHFAPGQYDPASQEGQRIIGHEMAHVVQQMQGRVDSPTGGRTPINSDQRLEAEADEWGAKATRGEPTELPTAGVIPSAAAPTANPPIQGMLSRKALAGVTGRLGQTVARSVGQQAAASGNRFQNWRTNALGVAGDVLGQVPSRLLDAAGGDSDPQQDDFERLGHLNEMVRQGHLTSEGARKIYLNQT